MIQKNKIFNVKFIMVLGLVLAVLAIVPFVGTAANRDTILPDVEPMAQFDDVKELTEIAPAAGEVVKEQAPILGAELIEDVESSLDVVIDEDVVEEKVPEIDYNTVLSFPMTEEKLKAFVMAADKIDQVNRKWDMLISGAETDTMAVEFTALSAEEMNEVMASITDITVAEYNEIYKYSTQNREFKKIVTAFKQHYVDGPRNNKN